jgi:hypothetical protein
MSGVAPQLNNPLRDHSGLRGAIGRSTARRSDAA